MELAKTMIFRRSGLLVLALLIASAWAAADAAGKGVGIGSASRGVELPGSPHRYVTLNPGVGVPMPTIVLRTERDGGRIDRWWRLRGHFYLPAAAYDLEGEGISADGRTLLLQRFTVVYPPQRTGFAVLDTAVNLNHPVRPGEERPPHAVRKFELPGFYSFNALSPDGETAYLTRNLVRGRAGGKFQLRALDLETGRLLPGAIGPGSGMEGLPVTQAISPDRRWVYTLYDANSAYGEDGGIPYLLALDTVEGRMRTVGLPQLREPRTLFLTRMRFAADGRRLIVFRRSSVQGRPPTPPLLAIDSRSLAVSDVGTAMAALGRRLMAVFAAALPEGEEPFLAFARTPRHPGNLLARYEVVGRSKNGEPIELRQIGNPMWSGELLVFESEVEPLTGGCPDPSADIFVVPDLHSELRMARRISRAVEPEATIWFREHDGRRPYVRADRRSADARAFAHLARMRFLPTDAPQRNAFVVELPRGEMEPAMESRLSKALVRMGRWVRED